MERGHGAVVIGSEMSGSVTDVNIYDCEFAGTDRGLRLKTRRGRGGEITRISIRDTKMDGVHTAVSGNCFYFCDADGKSDWVQSRSLHEVDETTPKIHGVLLENLEIRNVRIAVGAFYGLPEAPIEGVKISKIRVTFDESAEGGEPVMACQIPAMHHEGFIVDNAHVMFDADAQFTLLQSESERAVSC